MVRDASLRYQNSINNPEESFVDDFDDLDETFNRHVCTPKASNVECDGNFSINDRPIKVNIFMIHTSFTLKIWDLGEFDSTYYLKSIQFNAEINYSIFFAEYSRDTSY